MSSALWLSLIAAAPDAGGTANAEALNEKIFLQAREVTEISPLRLRFLKGEVQLTDNNREMIRQWAEKVAKFNIPVYIHSYASAPTGIRNLTPEAARHEAVRIAFNRGLMAKNFLEQSGISHNRLILKSIGPQDSDESDSITITSHQN
ncbi:MAG TPA: hypothetical protein ENI91_03940 [Sphingomonadales bacterium]|nr:hypothetical protein [Sphingomonadales bacterium]